MDSSIPGRMKPKTANKWDRRYFWLARRVSKWSKDPKAKVGAVLLNRWGWPIALGYNGFPAGIEDDVDKLADSKLKNDMVVHAEQNVLLVSGASARGGTMYVYGKPVCPRCAVLIIQGGLERVVGIQPDPESNPGSDTHKSGQLSLKMFKEAKVAFTPLDPKILLAKRKKKTSR